MSEFREAIRLFNHLTTKGNYSAAKPLSKSEARAVVRQRYPRQGSFREGVVR